jgi:Tfp pilus assembly protein PilF
MKTLRIKLVAATGLGFCACILPSFAQADVSAADKLVATQLFKEGRTLLDQGQVAQACQKLEESQRIDPGGGTLLNLALCHERQGRTATAWEEFTEALGIAKRDDNLQRIEFARAHIAQLEPVLSRLFVQVPTAADLPDLEIKRDGSPLGRAAWGSSIPVDPGDHLIEATAPGRTPWKELIVTGAKADTKTVVVPILQSAPAQDNSHAAGLAGATSTNPPPPRPVPANATSPNEDSASLAASPAKPAESSGGGSAIPAWITLGLGIAATGVGTYFAIHAILEKDDADRECPHDLCSAQGASDNREAIKSANFATAGLAVGGAGVGVGIVLFAIRGAGAHAAEPGVKAQESALAAVASGLSFGPSSAEFRFSQRW